MTLCGMKVFRGLLTIITVASFGRWHRRADRHHLLGSRRGTVTFPAVPSEDRHDELAPDDMVSEGSPIETSFPDRPLPPDGG